MGDPPPFVAYVPLVLTPHEFMQLRSSVFGLSPLHPPCGFFVGCVGGFFCLCTLLSCITVYF